MAKNYWVISRPKRKLILVPTILNIFASTTEGEVWTGNRPLQLRFEQNLMTSQWKAQNISEDASGGRTYAVMLFMLGLWYEDDQGVQITNAGLELINGDPPVPILTKQLLDFQYPSPYSLKSNVNISHDFHVQPHRFILRLFLESDFDVITKDEIAFCIVPFAKRNQDLDECTTRIHAFRESKDIVIRSAINASGTTEDNLKNIGNTIVNQMEYTGYFEEHPNISQLELKLDKKQSALDFLSERRKSFIQNPDDVVLFQTRYGSGLSKTKDYRRSRRKPIDIDPNERLVLQRFYIISTNEPITAITYDLIQRISSLTGVPVPMVQKVLDRLPVNLVVDQFERSYLQLSVGGKRTARDFEKRTSGIFAKEGFGLESEWVGNKPRHPDAIVYFDLPEKKHGVVDTKAYSAYPLPIDHKNKMAHTYIPNFYKQEHDNRRTKLGFYCYIAGGFSPTMNKSFSELTRMADVPGSYITAENLMKLLRHHKRSELSADELMKIFTCGSEIIYEEIAGRGD